MQAYDLIMLIVIGMATIFGAIKGFAWQVASLASIFVSYAVAYRFRFDVAEMIQAKPPWNQFLAMLILYIGTSFVIWVGFRLLSGSIDRVRLKEFDRHLGAAFGLAKGLVYCLLITMFATSLLGPNQQAAICQSRSGYYIARALDNGMGVLPKEIHDVVGPYLTRLDDKLKNGGAVANGGTGEDGSIWPFDGTRDIQGVPGFPEALQNGIRGALPQLAPAAGTAGAPPSPSLRGDWSQGDWRQSSGSVVPGLPTVLPGSFDSSSIYPQPSAPTGSLSHGTSSVLLPSSIYPQAGAPTTNPSPQIYPPLDQSSRLPQSAGPMGEPGSGQVAPSYNSGLRPLSPTSHSR